MKRLLYILIMLPNIVFAQYLSKVFSFEDNNEHFERSVLCSFTNVDSIIPLNGLPVISGFWISGNINMDNEQDSYVRITIEDSFQNEHLVYECYPLLSSEHQCRFYKTGIETTILNNLQLSKMRIETRKATLNLDSIFYSIGDTSKCESINITKSNATRRLQCEYIANKIDSMLIANNKTWRAGVTDVALMSFEEKKELFGGSVPFLYGFEYYKAGVFVMPDFEREIHMSSSDSRSNNYPTEWDWRNRHGKNWMTSIKDQGSCGSCWAFSAIGTFEAYINLYYNQLINYDLSEQEVLSCSNAGTCGGGSLYGALNYIQSSGAIPESCFPYSATDEACTNQCVSPNEKVSFGSKSQIANATENSVKQALLRSPITFGIDPWWHFIVLTGYKQIQSGDNYFTSGNHYYTIPIASNDPLIGHPAWLIKNSWGTSWGDNGYGYVAMSLSDSYEIYKLLGKVHSLVMDDSDVICEDADNDGYYFWGIGSKPTNCPACCPDIPDGDDSDPTKAEMDSYGNFATYTFPYSTTTISNTTTWNTNRTHCGNIIVTNNATLTITAELTMNPAAKIIVQNGGTLIVNAGTIQNATIDVQSSAKIQLLNNGTLYLKRFGNLNVQLGAEADIEYGSVLLY